jgi:serine/threonine protein kinase
VDILSSVISPPGRGLRDFRSIPQLLEAFRDAIKADRSLLMDGKILHRDISENNTIITDPGEADGFAGALIDLDLAKELGSGPSGARHRTGTMHRTALAMAGTLFKIQMVDLRGVFAGLWF